MKGRGRAACRHELSQDDCDKTGLCGLRGGDRENCAYQLSSGETAGALLAFASGATLPEAALVGCLVASITVQQLATTGTATPAQVRERLEMWRSQNA